jgi:hypothetical protein
MITQLSPELLISVAVHLENLRDFIKLWIVLKLYRQELKNDHTSFWFNLLNEFLTKRNLSIEETDRIRYLTSYYKRHDVDGRNNPDDYFLLIRILFQKSKCSRSGCFRGFYEWQNNSTACLYHPGKLKNGRYMTCCRAKSFQSMGCKAALHDGKFHFMAFLRRDQKPHETEGKLPVISSTASPAKTISSQSTAAASPMPPAAHGFLPPIR